MISGIKRHINTFNPGRYIQNCHGAVSEGGREHGEVVLRAECRIVQTSVSCEQRDDGPQQTGTQRQNMTSTQYMMVITSY